MRIHITLMIGAVFALTALSGCNPRKLDEKLDAEYQIAKHSTENTVVRVDTLREKIIAMRETHEQQEDVIEEHRLSAEDDSVQAKHDVWFLQFQPVMDSIAAWEEKTRNLFAQHQALEAGHDEDPAGEIRTEHELMEAQLDTMEVRGEGYFKELAKADTIIGNFLDEHRYIAKKYGITLEKPSQPLE